MFYFSVQRKGDKREFLNNDLIRKVKSNDGEAILTLLDIYESEIRKHSMHNLYDNCGNIAAVYYDEDLSSYLRESLIRAFKKIRLPAEK